MLKNKKLLISLILAILIIIAVGFLIWKKMPAGADKENKGKNIEISVKTGDDNAIVKELSSGELKADNKLAVKILPAQAGPDLNKEIVIKGNFSPEVINAYRQNIKNQITALKTNSEDFGGWIRLGTLREMVEDYDGAIEAWNYASALMPANSVSYYNLGFVYGSYLHNLPKAEKNYLKSIECDPQYYQAYIDIADIYWADNKGVKQTRIENILEKGINTVSGENKNPIIQRLAKYYEDIKDFVNAAKYYDLLLKAEPDNGNIQQKLIELQRQ